jgi:hypothetical protein
MILGWTLLLLGGFTCLVNFYLSFIRYPLFRAFGGEQRDWRWKSGFPLVGSLLVGIAWIGWLRGLGSSTVDVFALVLVALDTGGLHWFILSTAYDAVFGSKDNRSS